MKKKDLWLEEKTHLIKKTGLYQVLLDHLGSGLNQQVDRFFMG